MLSVHLLLKSVPQAALVHAAHLHKDALLSN